MSRQTLYMWKYDSNSNSYILANLKYSWKYLLGVIFLGWRDEQILGWWDGLPSMENHVMYYFWVYMIHYSCLCDSAKNISSKSFSQVVGKMYLANQFAGFF